MALGIGGWIARAGQGMKGVGPKLAPAYAMAKTAAPAVGGAIQGVGIGAGVAVGQLAAQPVKGFVGFFANFIPENIYGWFLWMGAFIYWLDWQAGFNAASTANFHLGFAIVAFLLIGLTQRFLNPTALLSTTGIFLSLIGFINATDVRGRGFAVVAFMIAFYFYSRVSMPGFFKFLPIVAFVDVYGMPVFRDVVLGYAANINYVSFLAAFVFNRILFPIWLWFGAIALYENTRVARKALALIIVFYFVVSLPTLTAAYKSKVAGLTPEEKEVAWGAWERFQTNLQRVLSGEFLRTPVASAYEGFERTFGFGEPKKEPKMGLQLRDDPNMPREFNLEFYDAPEPSVIMEVPNPLPVNDPINRIVKVADIDCKDKSGSAGSGEVIEPSPKPELGKPDTYTLVYYRGAKPVKCKFQDAKEGGNTAEIEVKYGFKADAELSTAFMRRDRLEAHVLGGKDPVVEDDVVPPFADYTNGPVAVTWGTVELVSTPVGIIGGRTLSLELYIAKSGLWEGELAGINSATLIIPSEFGFVETNDKTCSFEKVKEGSNEDINVYKVKDSLIKKDNGGLRFIGDGIRFVCKMSISSTFIDTLAGDPNYYDPRPKWKGKTFKASIDYIFSTKKTVSFEVEGCNSGDVLDCKTEKKGCQGSRICNADRTWGRCEDKPGDECIES